MEVLEQEFESVPVGKLTPHPDNANVGAKARIAESMDVNGFYGACIVQRSTGFILAGNHRWEVAVEEGATEVPVLWVDVDDEHAKRIMAVDNPTNRAGYTDDERLASLLSSFGPENLRGTGYQREDLDALLAKLADVEPPTEFQRYDSDIKIDHVCPKCGYEFSGSAKARASDAE